jgi:hypothetical protein
LGELEGWTVGRLAQERTMINYRNTLQDDNNKFVHSAAERKDMMEASKARTAAVKPLEKEKKEIVAVFAARTKALSKLQKKQHCGDSPIKNGLEKLLAIFGIDRAAYHGGDLNGKNVQQMFQESDDIFLQFKELLLEVDKDKG